MPTAPLPRSLRIGYGLGSFCAGTFSTVPGLLLLYYMTNSLGVPAGLAGLAVFLPKAWDLVVNPVVGRWSDRTVSRMGARRPWLLAGAVVLPPTFVMTFAGSPVTGATAALYVGGWFLLAATAYALFEVPYKAMPAEMTDDYHEQSTLLTWRMGFLGLAILLAGGLAPALVNIDGGEPTLGGYRLMAMVIGTVVLLAMVATFFGTARAPHIDRAETEHVTVRAQLAAARGNRPFMLLLGLSCAQMLAVGIMLAGSPYFASYILEDTGAITTMFLALIGPMIVIMPVWVRVSRRFDKRGGMLAASLLFMIGGMSLSATPAFGEVYAHGCVMLTGIGYAGLQLLQFSMLADTLIYDELRSGKRRAGVFTGLWTAAETVMMAFGALVLGWILAASGFVSSQPDEPVSQPDSAIDAILFGGALAPALLLSIAIACTLQYDLSAERLNALRKSRDATVADPA
ncbi:MFS transporter [Actinomadura rugatobispora]|uniref:MFS transporter n=1 Tax=Actinomadura rugatobispora TaxID=1994 RepID=A0ABW1AHP3_9ACTN|nr:MFS transporter [Actinomadura rugatobispora]